VFVLGVGEAPSLKGSRTAGEWLQGTPMKRMTCIMSSLAACIETIHVFWGPRCGSNGLPLGVGSDCPLLQVIHLRKILPAARTCARSQR